MREFSKKQKELIKMYTTMAKYGYNTKKGEHIGSAYNDFELRRFKHAVKPVLHKFKVNSILDYGCGGSDWKNMIRCGLRSQRLLTTFQKWRGSPARPVYPWQQGSA